MLEKVDITSLSGFHTPAKARYFVEYTGENIADVQDATKFANENKLPILVIGGGRNMLFAFDEYPGLVIYNNSRGYTRMTNDEGRMTKMTTDPELPLTSGSASEGVRGGHSEIIPSTNYQVLTTLFRVASGHPIWELAEDLENKYSIPYWHRFLGLPGSIGGSVFGNAGCFGLEIGPYVEHVEILNLQTGEISTKTGAEMNFGYRWSECKNHPEWFLLSVDIDLSKKIEKYASDEEPLRWREEHQPEGLSCGSFFKNPSREQSAGSLVEQAGLKGYHHGGAYFSDKHANFLMSDGTANSTELVELVELAQQKVFEQFGIRLEPEVRIIRT